MMLTGYKLENLEDSKGWTLFDECHCRERQRKVLHAESKNRDLVWFMKQNPPSMVSIAKI